MDSQTVWVVNSVGASLTCAVFLTEQKAVEFIRRHSLTCTLSEFPLDESTYDPAVSRELFRPKNERETSDEFIGDFSPRLPHFHFEEGRD